LNHPHTRVLFSFPCYAHHRDLPSFPTRRSSDLVAPSHFLCGRTSCTFQSGASYQTSPTKMSSLPSLLKSATPTPSERKVLSMTIDRKSTRLNSSHSQISYAVFCLKKKTYTLIPL